jgi:hypothetical protein
METAMSFARKFQLRTRTAFGCPAIDEPAVSEHQYQSLADTHSPSLQPGPVEILYAADPTFSANGVTRATLDQTHVVLGSVIETDENRIFHIMQGEVWSPKGEANTLIMSLGLTHTSMSVGDAIRYPDGRILVCDNVGWKELP